MYVEAFETQEFRKWFEIRIFEIFRESKIHHHLFEWTADARERFIEIPFDHSTNLST